MGFGELLSNVALLPALTEGRYAVFGELLSNVALLLALSILYSYIARRWRGDALPGRVFGGLAFGGAAIVGMLHPLHLLPGVVFDGRSIMVSVAGLFMGPLAAAIAAAMAVVCRFAMGGAGATTGIGVIITSAALGVAYRRLRRRKTCTPSTGELLLLGVVVHVAMLLWMLTLPGAAKWEVLRRISLPVMVIFPLGTVLLGRLLADQRDRIAAEEALRETSTRLALALRASNIGLWDRDLGTNQIYFSPEWKAQLGYGEDEIPNCREEWESRLHPEDHDRVVAALDAYLRGEVRDYDVEFRLRHKDGTYRWIHTRGQMLSDSEGKPVRMLGCHVDVTDRKRAEQERDRLFDLSIDMLTIAGFDGYFKQVNSAWTEALGWTQDELLSKPWLDFVHPEDRAVTVEAGEHLRSGKHVRQLENRYRCRDGSYRWVAWDCFSMPEERLILAVTRDVTESKKAEERITSLARFPSENPNPVFRADMTGVLLYANEACAPFLRCWKRKVGDRLPDDVCQLIVRGRDANATVREDVKCANRVLSLTVAPAAASGYVNCYAQDITERLSLEEQLRQSQKLEAVGRLAGGVAHEFNNILTGIIGLTQFALDELDGESGTYRDLSRVHELSKRASVLTRQLLAFSRRQPMSPEVLDLNGIVADLSKMLRRLIGEDIDLQFIAAPGQERVCADRGQIEQVLMNLVVNARDAMPDGGKLTIETANATLDRQYADDHPSVTPGAYVMLAVSDTGDGMDAETKGRLFEPFFTTKEQGKGTGLGLATVYGIVKQHGGSISVHSEPGEGACFRIYLPCAAEGVPEVARLTEPEPLPEGSETILAVDDDEAVRAIAQRALTAQGYVVLAAASADEAEQLLADHPGDVALLLTDMVLPGRNGTHLYEAAKAGRPRLRVLYMSGYTENNAVLRHGALEPGASFIQKPFSPERLVQRVREVLDS